MILSLSFDKQLTAIKGNEKFYRGENNASRIHVTLESQKINNLYKTWECATELHIVFPDDRELVYALEMPTKESSVYTASVPVTLDLTDTEQTLGAYLKITHPSGAVIKSNLVDIPVYDSPDGGETIVPRAELEAELAEIAAANEELEAVLDGTYVPEEENTEE